MGSLWGKSRGGENEVFYQTSSLRAVSNTGKNVSFQCLFLSPRNTEKFLKALVLCVFTSHNQIWTAQAAKWIQINLLNIHKSTQSLQWKKTKADQMLQLLSTAFHVNMYIVQFSFITYGSNNVESKTAVSTSSQRRDCDEDKERWNPCLCHISAFVCVFM